MTGDTAPPALDASGEPARDEAAEIPAEEERLLERVGRALGERATGRGGATGPRRPGGTSALYDQELVALRDEIGEARREDVPALIAQMERLQGVSLRRAEAQGVLVDPLAPYFGHLRLREEVAGRPVVRDVLIGRATFVDPQSRINIVDWRHAPVSQLYYRYEEGSDYEERFGEREVEGEILARRTLTIAEARLGRVACPQGVFARGERGWERHEAVLRELAGGQGTAQRPHARGVLGAAGGGRAQRLDRHLPEIAALLDPRQFELITGRHSGLCVIQGGAGSGKTTIGLHRIAYLAYAFPDLFPPKRMLVLTYGLGLAAYISEVLPALGIHGVRVVTYRTWAERELRRAIPWLDPQIVDDTPPLVSRLKNHPALLHELERRVRAHDGPRSSRAVVELWAELVTDRVCLTALLAGDAAAPMTAAEIGEAHRFITERVSALMERDPAERRAARREEKAKKLEQAAAEKAARKGRRPKRGPAKADDADDDDQEGDDQIRGDTGIDGERTVDDRAILDLEDAALLLRAHQLLRGTKRPIAHLFVDEAQDLSPAQLSVLVNQTTPQRSVTLAGDTSQRLFLDNGFADWRSVLGHLSLSHVAVEPLKVAYRSTREILALARHAMGKLADAEPPQAPRSGAPVEAHRLPGTGAAVAFLAEALRPLFQREPQATVAILARHPEQADRYWEGLSRAEVPALRRVRAQDFSFRPGVEVTEIRQVKGLEFDYVIIVDANTSTFGKDDESRHLFHIAATRAAHQLWLLVTGRPSALIPPELLGA